MGLDGSNGHGECKQRSLEVAIDNDIFTTSVFPSRFCSIKPSRDKAILWQNPRPSSVRYCRPIRIQFKKETTKLAKEET